MGRRQRHPKQDGPQRGTSKPGVPEEDAALWQAFTKGIEQARFRPRVPETEVSGEALRSARGETTARGAEKVQSATARRAGGLVGPQTKAGADAARRRETPPQAIDGKAVRRLGSGRTGIDARVDLHGLRQSEAHAALRRFLFGAAAKGHRMVLVITGKGSRRAASAIDYDGAGFGFGDERESGVLRRQVPLWLGEPEFQAIVVGFTTAHIRHGGEGALYVQLRRRRS